MWGESSGSGTETRPLCVNAMMLQGWGRATADETAKPCGCKPK